MNHLSLFSGIGGIDLAAEWAEMKTVAFCEREPFPQKVLKKHWPDAPIYDDVKTLTKERLEADGIDTGAIGIISAGYPCQPESYAGKRKGKDDNRWLWPEAFRIIQEIQPRWFVGENVAGHITMGLDSVLTDLESIDYEAQTFVIPAAAVGAFHRRDRVFIVANISSLRVEGSCAEQILGKSDLSIRQTGKSFQEAERRFNTFESRLCRTLHGLPNGVDRVKSLGNAVVPGQIYPILAAIKAIDDMIQQS
ncbi:DNA cytosine methyltransferase [Paenibacillus sp. D2_2]|uniref:DNA cytosine methyltransferase n=1 Tax=Paenibacillus sp. D2_2 TaxID=3073092 RepID=UPI002815DB4E|nr:DNA cytosine methyltransferase [Paenibacillus sp. D2_2]WMT42819.1 DNA cytosine methyltransferase [Paenibacillus sp. D2_2]